MGEHYELAGISKVVKQMKDGSLDFNGMLMGLSLIIASMLLSALTQTQGNEYVNQESGSTALFGKTQASTAALFRVKKELLLQNKASSCSGNWGSA
jgi:hypothetical protein